MGPIFGQHLDGGPDLLAACYTNSLDAAERLGLASIAFPAISTDVYGWLAEPAAHVAVSAIQSWSAAHPDSNVNDVRLVAYSSAGAAAPREALAE